MSGAVLVIHQLHILIGAQIIGHWEPSRIEHSLALAVLMTLIPIAHAEYRGLRGLQGNSAGDYALITQRRGKNIDPGSPASCVRGGP
jgi:hypothetical protein